MKRKRAVKLLMSNGLSRNESELYLDELHAFGLTNFGAFINSICEFETGTHDIIHFDILYFISNNIGITLTQLLGIFEK